MDTAKISDPRVATAILEQAWSTRSKLSRRCGRGSYTKLRNLSLVMPALVAGIHVFFVHPIKAVMAETSPWDKPGHDGGRVMD